MAKKKPAQAAAAAPPPAAKPAEKPRPPISDQTVPRSGERSYTDRQIREREQFKVLSEANPRAAAAKIIRHLYGVGVTSSEAAVAKLSDETIEAMNAAELDGRRDRVPGILNKAHPTKR